MITKEQADKAYEEGQPLMTDSEYDKTFGSNATVEALPENSPWKKIKHKKIGCGSSLGKVPIIEDGKVVWDGVKQWLEDYASKVYILMYKYDGLSIYLHYKKGVCKHAVTKGARGEGEDILRNVKKMKNFKDTLPEKFTGILKAEIIIRTSVFNKKLKNKYDNPRNGAVGAAKTFDGKNAKYCTLRYFEVVSEEDTFKKKSEELSWIKQLGLKSVFFKKCRDLSRLQELYSKILDSRDSIDFDIDGLVLTVDSKKKQNKFGYEDHGNPKFSVALKFPYQLETSTLRDIEWNLGSTGKITPVGIFDEIYMGAKVSRATLCNVDEINKLWGERGPHVGDEVAVSRRGDVIPKIEKITKAKGKKKLELPENCPCCDAPAIIEGAFLTCLNEQCESRQLGNLNIWISKMKFTFGFKDLGPERIYEMYHAGIVTEPADFYVLTPEMLIENLDRVKEKSAKNMLAFQEQKKINLSLFLGALNIPNIGQSIFEYITEAGYNTLEDILAVTTEDLVEIKGISEVRAQIIVSWLKKKKKTIKKLTKYVYVVPDDIVEGDLNGTSFCFTGSLAKPRSYYEDLVKKGGGEIKAVSKNLNYLVAGKKAGSKLAKAEKMKVEVITEEEFLAMV